MIYDLGSCRVQTSGDEFYVAPSAAVIGRVFLGRHANVWFSAVVRGDVNDIRIGDDTIDIDEIEAKQMRLGSLIVQIEPGPESDSATIGFVALDPADYQSDLRRRARDILRSN